MTGVYKMNIPKLYTVIEVKFKKRLKATRRDVSFISILPVSPITDNFKSYILKQEGY